MKLSKMMVLFLILQLCMVTGGYADLTDDIDSDYSDVSDTSTSDTPTGGFVIGATTIDGVNYQQIGIRADFPIGKLGFGLDIQLLLDEEGSVREEDWDDTEDYFNILYYIRWDKKGAPFYTKIGGLDYSYIGFSNIVNGYSNMIEYPDYKRIGMEMEINLDNFRAELLINDYKELAAEEPSVFAATRLAYKIGGVVEIGLTAASDFNEYNGFKDNDDDGFPNEIDDYDDDKNLVTEYEYFQSLGVLQTTLDDLVATGYLTNETSATLSEFNFSNKTSDLTIWGIDIGIPIVQTDFIKMDLYSAYSEIIDYGWGVTAPGFRTIIGDIFTVTAEYRTQSKEFLYGYFDQSYELERAQFYKLDDGTSEYSTKQDKLKEITEDMNGYLLGLSMNLQGYLIIDAKFQDMRDDDDTKAKSLTGELTLNENKISMLPMVKAYYMQNNVETLNEWKSPNAVAGIIIQMKTGGATLAFNHRYTFVDINNDGEIKGDEETVKTLSISTTVAF